MSSLRTTSEAFEPLVAPFSGWMVKPEWADRVISRAYDNLTPDQRRSITLANPYSYVNVTRSNEDILDDDDLSIPNLVTHGAAALTRLLDAEVFAETGRRALYLYRLTHSRACQTGLICTVPVSGYCNDRIRIHEGVRDDRAELLTSHLLGVGASSSPASLTVREAPEFEELLDAVTDNAAAELTFGSDLVRHEIWTVPEELTEPFVSSLATKVLYVTDGHHRSAAAQRALARHPEDPVLTRTLASVFPHRQLHVEAYHRMVADQRHSDPADTLLAIQAVTRLDPAVDVADALPRCRGEVGVYLNGSWFRLTLPPAPEGAGSIDSLDVERLRCLIIDGALGADELATNGTVDYLPDTAGLVTLMQSCDSTGRVGFVMYPLEVDELLEVADARTKMPPKSSFFYPKTRAGIFLRVLGRGATAHLTPS